MAQTRRKLEERNIRKITKMAGGSSYGITLPIEDFRAIGWKEKQKVVVKRVPGGFTIRDWRKK